MACISWRLYFITGHWPVEVMRLGPAQADADAQIAGLAFSSTPPGSSVTYRPGMPMAPPARVTSISEFSTVAGRSVVHPCRGRALQSRRNRPHNPLPARPGSGQSDRPARHPSSGRRSRSRSSWPAPAARGIMSPTITHGRAQQVAGGRAGESDRACARNIDDRPGAHARRHRAVIAGRENIGEQVRSLIFAIAWSCRGTSAG